MTTTPVELHVPTDALIVLVGVAGSGKSTLAARLFRPDQVLSSDEFRRQVAGDPSDQTATAEAFGRLFADLDRRLSRGELTVVDATSVQSWARRRLVDAARVQHRPAVAVVLAIPLAAALGQNRARSDRQVPDAVIRRQFRDLAGGLAEIGTEGFLSVTELRTPDAVASLRIRAQRNVPKEQHPVH